MARSSILVNSPTSSAASPASAGSGSTGRAAGPSDIHLVRYIPSQEVDIEAGENAGKHITYTNVVTGWETIARWDGSAPVDMRYEGLEEGPVAVIVQRARMGQVVAAGTSP